MTVVATAPASVALQTCPQEVPSLPAWFAEVTLLAHHLTQRGILDALCEQVHLARGRAGHYEVIDFLAVLFGYAISGEPTLEAFFERLAPFASRRNCRSSRVGFRGTGWHPAKRAAPLHTLPARSVNASTLLC